MWSENPVDACFRPSQTIVIGGFTVIQAASAQRKQIQSGFRALVVVHQMREKLSGDSAESELKMARTRKRIA